MMIDWNDFANRRKLNLEAFKEWSYEDYSEWCTSRYVTPVSAEAFEGVKTMMSKEPVVNDPVPMSIDEKQLKKTKKQDLIELCNGLQINLDGNETKASLIKLILNNDSK